MHGPTGIFFANLIPFSLPAHDRRGDGGGARGLRVGVDDKGGALAILNCQRLPTTGTLYTAVANSADEE